jgi:hypothetical protein
VDSHLLEKRWFLGRSDGLQYGFSIVSRTTRKPWVQDRGGTRAYHRRVRRVIKHRIQSGKDELPNAKEIVNDYDYRDYRFKVNSTRDRR